MKLGFKKNTPDKIIHTKTTKRWLLLIPFMFLTLILVIVPMILIFVKSFLKIPNNTIADN
jgi:ABC-type sugar transport system permease subunit